MAQAANPMSQADSVLDRRPGLVTFAAIMMFVLAGFQLTYAIIEFVNATWVAVNVRNTFGGPLWLWGIIDLVFALIYFYAGYDLLQGGEFGRIFGLFVAGLSAIRWFFYIPAAPWAAVVVISIDILIIYGLVAHAEYFRSARAAR
jgi:hypothetical protein